MPPWFNVVTAIGLTLFGGATATDAAEPRP